MVNRQPGGHPHNLSTVDLLAAIPNVAANRDPAPRPAPTQPAQATEPDPVAALSLLPAGKVDVVANYTGFRQLLHRLVKEPKTP